MLDGSLKISWASWRRCSFDVGLCGEAFAGAASTTRRSVGFATYFTSPHYSYKCLEVALYHTLGRFPEPVFIHEFC